ncbi:hypothetical protein MSG28_007670 [Choristoneura fumiferana]|uniref:Uncharacterized protein n=1 Tax=Choristoneura fumiferana TaxID=7141 RepID=A0ACC0JXZ7_CHOFU|nr:hypothetical protein MSG28_007670 [Choristoneura fumiferana]
MSSPVKKRIKKSECKIQVKSEVVENMPPQIGINSKNRIEIDPQKDLAALRRKNFVTACEKVSCEAYFNRQKRLQLVYFPACAKGECKHSAKETQTREMPPYAVESFKIEVNTGMWYDALEVCQISITYEQYLSAEVLKEIVEIMMNVNEVSYTDYTIEELIDKCQQVLAYNFSSHPPCEDSIRKCYKNFLMSPMDLRKNTYTNRENYDYSHGIVKYCMQRLADDINEKSKDEPIVNKYENIPDEMKEGVQGLHWQKEKFDIFELLTRPERIKRLMAVLNSIIELLQFDLAIWQSRQTSKLGRHIMEPRKKPLIALLLWSSNPLTTGAVTSNCHLIMELFINIVQLQYPEEDVRVMTMWLNTMIQIFYVCETKSNSDYPNLGKYCAAFAVKFYEKIKCLPRDSVCRILERVQPSFMQHLIGMHITKDFLNIKEDNVIKILIDFVKNHKWEEYKESDEELQIMKGELWPEGLDSILHCLANKMDERMDIVSNSDNNNNSYPKLELPEYIDTSEPEQNHAVHVLYVTFAAYLDAYSVQSVQDTLDNLNEELLQGNMTARNIQIHLPEAHMYSVSEEYIKKYRTIYQTLKELLRIWLDLKGNKNFPNILKVFENLSLLA